LATTASGAIIGGLGKEDFMIRRTTVLYRAVLALASLSSSWVAPALAQAPQASPVAQDKAAAPAKKAGEPGTKPDNKPEKAAPKEEEKPNNPAATQAKIDNKGGDNTVGAVERKEPDDPKLKDRLQRRKSQQDTVRAKIAAALRGQPMTEAMQQELRRHARRLARLERIKALAVEAKDTAVVDRVTKLIDKENARHDKFTARVEDKDDKGKDDKGKDDKGKDDKGKDDKGKDDKAGAK
jgi:hypothetical protein